MSYFVTVRGGTAGKALDLGWSKILYMPLVATS